MHGRDQKLAASSRFPGVMVWALALAFTAMPVRPVHAEVSQPSAAVFDEAWRLVRDNFYDRTMRGLDWDKVGDKHRSDYLAAHTDKERSAAINALLKELGASHMLHAT